ncbi:AMP-binding protein [Auritidibacter ignavus]|uniref:AMP-binding protein n=1 Tax=Auritidibacter ignavus TaxID=678932 RepID=UPI00244BF94E|nr:AMP-binding protein [Auritidibacter ignavus]WGH85492.1 AMP-binding protein [Auritidibacter ignavus]WGH87778.1 AMP-binding protein [Auritidibacter ignavus]
MQFEDLETYVSALREIQTKQRPDGLPHEVTYPAGEITIPAHISHWAVERPEEIAIAFEGRNYTYAELDSLHRRFAGWLSNQGVSRGDRVAVFLGNCPEFVIAFLAVLRLGAVHVPVNPMFAPAELTHELRDSEPKIVLTQESLAHSVDQVQPQLDNPISVLADTLDWEKALAHEPYTADDGDLDSLAALNYTGGTTGLPKGCQHSQRHMLYTAVSGAAASGLDSSPGFTSLCYLPIFWIAGEDLGILIPFVLGGTSVLLRRWDPDAVLDAIETYRVQIMVGTVENYLELMERPDINDRDLSSLVDPQTVSFVRKLTPEVRANWYSAAPSSGTLREASYGMTETHTLDSAPYGFAAEDKDLRAEPIFCGLPVPGTDIAVVEFGTQRPLPLGGVGEIIVRSPSITDGYWRNPEATQEQLVDGWVHTGDNGRIDAEGFLHYLGRRKEMIKVKGMSVFPAEVEMLLTQHPEVESVAVVPAEDPETGQRPVAFVQLRKPGTVSTTDLEEWAKENMATYKVPLVRIEGELPMTATGKIRKGELLKMVNE